MVTDYTNEDFRRIDRATVNSSFYRKIANAYATLASAHFMLRAAYEYRIVNNAQAVTTLAVFDNMELKQLETMRDLFNGIYESALGIQEMYREHAEQLNKLIRDHNTPSTTPTPAPAPPTPAADPEQGFAVVVDVGKPEAKAEDKTE